jgi:hypothetical protein
MGGGTNVYHYVGTLHYSDRSLIPTGLPGRAPLTTFICVSCGYIEDYLDTTKVRPWGKSGRTGNG